MAGGATFERELRKRIENYCVENQIPAVVKRIKQEKFQPQGYDLEVDSPVLRYLAIECKSRKFDKKPAVFVLSNLFQNGQFERIQSLLERSGRRGFLAIEARIARKKTVMVIKWDVIARLRARNVKQFKLCDGDDFVPYQVLGSDVWTAFQ